MAAVNRRQTEAQSKQIPPAVRLWAQRECRCVDSIERFRDEHEKYKRGYKIVARSISLLNIPDGYEVVSVHEHGDSKVILHMMDK